jgi:coenzyme F420 hydrogenase subunit beta
MQLEGKPKSLIAKIEFMLGIWEGGNFYFRGTEHLLKSVFGIQSLKDVKKLTYRSPYPDPTRGAFIVTTKDGETHRLERHAFMRWVGGYPHDRCLMCYDWTAELADVSFGGYAAPGYLVEEPGNPIERWGTHIVRTKKGDELVKAAIKAGYLKTEPIEGKEIIQYASHRPGASPGFLKKKCVFHIEHRKKHGWPTPNYHYPIKSIPPPKFHR